MIPESKLIKSELTIRELSLPDDVALARKSLVRWLALSLGLINPNESRTLLMEILDVLVHFHMRKEQPTTKDIIDGLSKKGSANPNQKAVYYHLQKLKDLGILSRKKGRYYFGDGVEEDLSKIFRGFYEKRLESAFSNIDVAIKKLESGHKA